MSEHKVVISYDQFTGEAPYEVADGKQADGYFSLEVVATPEQEARWKAARAEYVATQAEMAALFTAAEQVRDEQEAAREAAERAEDRQEADAEAEKTRLREAELDKLDGPREWAIVTNKRGHSQSRVPIMSRVVHRASCASLKLVRDLSKIGSPYLRRPDALQALEPFTEGYYGLVHTTCCQRCAIDLQDKYDPNMCCRSESPERTEDGYFSA